MELATATRQLKKALVRRLVIEQRAYKVAEAETKRELKGYFAIIRGRFINSRAVRTAFETAEAHRNQKAVDPDELEQIKRILEDVDQDPEELKRILKGTLVTGYNLGGRRAILLLGTTGTFDLRNPRILNFLDKHAAELVTNIGDRTRERLAYNILKAADQGSGLPGVYRNIRQEFTQFSTARARMIARTELAFSSGEARQQVFLRSRVKKHDWVTAGDELVGKGHTDCIDNEAAGAIAVGATFPSGVKAEPAHPNCRCTTLPVVPDNFEPSELWQGV